MELARRQHKHLNVVRSNDLVNARIDFTADKYKLILCAAAQIRQDDKDFTIYWVDIHLFRSLKESSNKGEGTRLRRITRELLSQPIEILTENGYEQFSFISYAKYEGQAGRIGIRFDPAMKPHLLQLKKNFTIVPLDVIVRFSSFYTMRIYELLKQFQVIGTRQLTMDELHVKLATPDSYRKNFNSFKKRVLDTAEAELNLRGDITFNWSAVKDGKSVVAVAFVIKDKGKPKPQVQAPPPPALGEEEIETCLVQEFRLTRAQARHVLDKYAPKYIKETLHIVREAAAAGRVKNIAAYTYRAFERDYRDKQPMPSAPADHVVELPAVGNDEEVQEAFDNARDEAIAVLLQDGAPEGLFAAFEAHLLETNRWYVDFVRKQLKGEPLDIQRHYTHFLPLFRAFIGERYLPERFCSLETWLGENASK